MADCAALLDEELSSFVFSYLTETSCSQYGEEEVCSDRLDTDFSDIDLSQLDTSDFDSVNCFSELQWCADHPADASPASNHYNTTDELFEIEKENATLLAVLTDSLDGIVDAEVGKLSVFPTLGEEPSQEEEDEESLPLKAEDFSQSLGAETEDLSLSDLPQKRKPRAVRPAGRLCTELHRHLTTAQDADANPGPEAGEDEEEDEDEDKKLACLCLPLNPKSTGESQYSSGPYEQTLSMDLCGTAGLTPPTTPPHKPVDDELFKPTEGGKVGSEGGGGGESNANSNVATKASACLSRAHHQRKLPEQTELYAQLRRMGQAGHAQRSFGDHDYCVLSLGESLEQNAATVLGTLLRLQEGSEDDVGHAATAAGGPAPGERLVMTEAVETQEQQMVVSASPPSDCLSDAATPIASEEEAECSSASRSPSPVLHMCPDSPSSKTDSSENSESCPDHNQRNKASSDEDNCQVFYIHHLPSRVTENMLRKRFQVFGNTEDCKVIICNEERCGVIKLRQPVPQRRRRECKTVFQNAPTGLRRLTRKRYIDLDEAGPGPVKSKYDALDFDTLLKEAQNSLHR
ncbi:peroxisome proliferator-activated receptor gamma coactivator 1-beta [Austrofundulus limnaeus]|uniref:Peroxisome proliferator-activated receptor gamma coactivator 1-beta n=1 Tax=Austrofundulus limnaeus TaxID=52670 RepID=A0A2I4ARU3_AUSLI|nr:PREDICTED: peroxisome proliferator-activated receptor gamma coactivator 1-beta-like [Austrofundulus limnaeus]